MGDFVAGYEASAWTSIGASKNTTIETIDKLNNATNTGLADPKIKTRLSELGAIPFMISPGDFAEFIARETEKSGKVVKFAGIKPE